MKLLVHSSRWRRAFSLVEMLVAVGLLSVIIIGLLAMFYQTQRALRLGVGQVDVMESGRVLMERLGQELQTVAAGKVTDKVNFQAQMNQESQPLAQSLPVVPTAYRTNILSDLFFLRQYNDEWIGTAYRISNPDRGAGTLYRLEEKAPRNQSYLLSDKLTATFGDKVDASLAKDDFRPLLDGVVHFRLIPYDHDGVRMFVPPDQAGTNDVLATEYESKFREKELPAYVEIELGILERNAYEEFRALPPAAAPQFLMTQAGKVHLFKKRVPLRAAP